MAAMSTEPPRTDAPPDSPRRSGIAGPILVVPLSFVIAIATFGALQAGGVSDDGSEAIAGLVGGVVILGLAVRLRSRLPRDEQRAIVAPRRSLAACVLVGLGLAVVLRIAAGAIVNAGQRIDPGLCDDLNELAGIVPTVLWHKVLLAIGLVVLAPVGEELLFRGLLLRGLAQRMPFAPAAVLSGVVFAVVHPQYWTLWPLLIAISIFGVVAAYVYRRMGYPATVAMHLFFNLVAAVLLFVDVEVQREDCS